MSGYQRPWWMLVNRTPALVTTVQEEATPTERVFTVHGEPFIQSLVWLTWGPAAALVIIVTLTGLAITLGVQEQSGLVKILFVASFVALPAFAWGVATIAANRLAQPHLVAERSSEAQRCVIRLQPHERQLTYRLADPTRPAPLENQVAYDQIQAIIVSPAIGDREGKAMRLVVESDLGPLILLNEALGSEAQKQDLAEALQAAIQQAPTQ